jgi:hypothetical protein
MTMEESITKNNSVEEEPSMAFEKQSLEKSKKAENMIGKVFTNLSTKPTLTLAKSASVKVGKTRPNYFLSVRLDSQGIRKNFSEFFNDAAKKFPEYKKMLIDPRQVKLFILFYGMSNI